MGRMVRRVHLAKPRGFCAGVVMAIEAVEEASEEIRSQGQGELAVYHPIVHNDTVVERLEPPKTLTRTSALSTRWMFI